MTIQKVSHSQTGFEESMSIRKTVLIGLSWVLLGKHSSTSPSIGWYVTGVITANWKKSTTGLTR
jgi:hypothetical protein